MSLGSPLSQELKWIPCPTVSLKLHSTGKGPSPTEKLLLEEVGMNDRQNQQKYGHQPARAGGWLTGEGGLKACAQVWSR